MFKVTYFPSVRIWIQDYLTSSQSCLISIAQGLSPAYWGHPCFLPLCVCSDDLRHLNSFPICNPFLPFIYQKSMYFFNADPNIIFSMKPILIFFFALLHSSNQIWAPFFEYSQQLLYNCYGSYFVLSTWLLNYKLKLWLMYIPKSLNQTFSTWQILNKTFMKYYLLEVFLRLIWIRAQTKELSY